MQTTNIMKTIGYARHIMAATAGLLLATASSQASLTLADLLVPGATLQVGDKVLANFSWSGAALPDPSQITITGVGTGVGLDYYGIRIQGGLVSRDGVGRSWELGYSVGVANALYLIAGITQYGNFSGTAGSTVTVNETVLNAPAGTQVAASHVGRGLNYALIDRTDPPAEINDQLQLTVPLTQVWVVKDITVTTTGLGDEAVISIIEQRFQQVPVPEPATMVSGLLLILPFGASALRILRRKQ